MSKQMNILIVDDAEYTRTMTLSMLHAINIHNITEADNGETALYILKTKEVDLVLLDVVMPGISGISETPSCYRVANTFVNTLDSCSISEKRSISGLKRISGIFCNNPNKRHPCLNTE